MKEGTRRYVPGMNHVYKPAARSRLRRTVASKLDDLDILISTNSKLRNSPYSFLILVYLFSTLLSVRIPQDDPFGLLKDNLAWFV